MRVQLRFSLDTENDGDIIAYLDTLSPHSKIKLFRDLVRQHIIGDKETVIDKLNKVIGIVQRIENNGVSNIFQPIKVSVIPDTNTYKSNEVDNDILINLDNLGK